MPYVLNVSQPWQDTVGPFKDYNEATQFCFDQGPFNPLDGTLEEISGRIPKGLTSPEAFAKKFKEGPV